MYFCRVLEGKLKPERVAAAIHLVSDRLERIRKVSGFLFVQVMRQGNEFIAVSSWKTLKDLRGVDCQILTIGQYLRPTPAHARCRAASRRRACGRWCR